MGQTLDALVRLQVAEERRRHETRDRQRARSRRRRSVALIVLGAIVGGAVLAAIRYTPLDQGAVAGATMQVGGIVREDLTDRTTFPGTNQRLATFTAARGASIVEIVSIENTGPFTLSVGGIGPAGAPELLRTSLFLDPVGRGHARDLVAVTAPVAIEPGARVVFALRHAFPRCGGASFTARLSDGWDRHRVTYRMFGVTRTMTLPATHAVWFEYLGDRCSASQVSSTG